MRFPPLAPAARAAIPSVLEILAAALILSLMALRASGSLGDGQPLQSALPAPRSSTQRLPVPNQNPDLNSSPMTPKQQRELLKANFAKMKKDADDLADLAKSLQDELNKSNENVLSLDVVEKADKIEKLAKRIKSSAVQ